MMCKLLGNRGQRTSEKELRVPCGNRIYDLCNTSQLKHPNGVTEVVGLIPSWDSDFFFRCPLIACCQATSISSFSRAHYTITIINN